MTPATLPANRAQRRAMARAEKRAKAPARRIDPLAALRAIKTAAILQSAETIDASQARDLALGSHSAFEALRTGRGTEDDMNTLAIASNIAMALCEAGLGREELPVVLAAQDAIVKAQARAAGTGRWGFDGPGLRAVKALLDVHDAQLESEDCSEGLLLASLLEVKRRAVAGHVLKAGAPA